MQYATNKVTTNSSNLVEIAPKQKFLDSVISDLLNLNIKANNVNSTLKEIDYRVFGSADNSPISKEDEVFSQEAKISKLISELDTILSGLYQLASSIEARI